MSLTVTSPVFAAPPATVCRNWSDRWQVLVFGPFLAGGPWKMAVLAGSLFHRASVADWPRWSASYTVGGPPP